MTNTQLWIAIIVPTFAVLLGILINHNGIGRLEARISSIEGRLTAMEGDLRRFFQILGEHSARLDARR